MTKRGLRALAVALVAALGFCGVASAKSAPLALKDAKKLARQLAEKQVRGRNVVSFHVLGGRRLSASRIVFPYDDRSADNIFCTATLVVSSSLKGTSTVIRANFKGQRCNRIPDDVLAVESATRAAVRALRGTAVATADSLDRLTRSIKRCRHLTVPRSRRAAVNAVVDVAVIEALEGPNDARVGDFVNALGKVPTTNAILQGGIAGWQDYLAVIRSLPQIPDPCATLQKWAQAGWSDSAKPIDMAAYTALERRATADQKAIARTATYMARVGVFPRTAVAFTPEGLLLRLAPATTGITGGKGRLALRKPALL